MFQKIADMKTPILVELYNSVADKPVKKFADRETAVARVEKIAAEKGMELGIADGKFVLLPSDGSVVVKDGEAEERVDPKEDAEEAPAKGLDTLAAIGKMDLDAPKKSMREQIDEAAAARIAKKKAQKPAKKGGRRGPAPEHDDSLCVVVAAESNPKKAGSASAARFALYKPGMSIGEYIAAGGTRADIKWDLAHGHIKLQK